MKHRLGRVGFAPAACLLAGLMGWSNALVASEPSASQQGVQPRVVYLDNGLKLLLVERHEQPTVAAGVCYDVGSVNDPRGKSGIAHLFEHMMFKGTKIVGTSDFEAERSHIEQVDKLRAKMNAEMNKMRLMKRRGEIDDVLDPKQWTADYAAMKTQYDELMEAQQAYIVNNEFANLYSTNGGRSNAGTAEDVTIYLVQLPANKLEMFFWLESDRMQNGIMREFYMERDVVREERRLRTESTPTGEFDEAFEALFWQTHPYGIPVLGWASEVESITRDDVRRFYRIYYAPNNARVVLVGDFDSDQVIDMAKRYFGRIPPGPKKPPLVTTEEPAPIAERRFYAEADTNPLVRLRYHTTAIGHTDEPALDVLGELLSGKSGRLYKRLVTQEDVVIGQPGAGNNGRKYAGFFSVNATVKEGRSPEKVEEIILEEIDKLREGEITEYELQKVKNQVLASSVSRLKSSFFLMLQLGFYDVWYDWSYINEAPKRMLEVTAADVRRMVNKYFDPKTRTVAIYRTKEAAPGEGEVGEAEPGERADPELEALLADLPPEAHGQIKNRVKQIKSSNDLAKLQQGVQMMEQMASSGMEIAEEQKALIDYTLKVMKSRIEELQASNKESQ